MESEYQGYRLKNVYRQIDHTLRQEIIDLWITNQTIALPEATRRVDEVVFIIRDPAGDLAGVSTAYLQQFTAHDDPFYFMRMFIRPEDRGLVGLYRMVSSMTRTFLKTLKRPECRPKGVIIVIENKKFTGAGNRKSLEKRGWSYWGIGPKGNQVWYECFDGSLLEPFSGLSNKDAGE